MVDKSKNQVRELFRQVAPRYDFLNHFLSCSIDKSWRRKLVKLVKPQDTDAQRILDVCTGTGDLATAFWQKYHIPVTGVDFTPEMLELGRRKLEKLGISEEQVQLQEGDACALSFEDGQFPIVSVAFGVRNVENLPLCLRELYRVCQSGGRVAILEFSTPRFFLFRWVYWAYFRLLLPVIGQLISRNKLAAYHYLPQSVCEFPDGEAFAALMREAGLQNIQIKPLTFGIATLYIGEKA